MKKALKILFIIPLLYLFGIPVYMSAYTNSLPCSGVEVIIRDSSDYHFVTERQLLNLVYASGGKLAGKPVKDISAFDIENRINVLRELKVAEVFKSIDGKVYVYVDQRNPVMRVMPES